MEFLALAHSLSQVMSAVSLDDSSMSALAMLAGIIGGWTITGLRQPKAKRVKVERKDNVRK